uniref:Uncharacterized protein n=1 Tax=Arundo donax TaxID=35708 RepID=A0A0A8ZYA5_ARUDO
MKFKVLVDPSFLLSSWTASLLNF